MLITANPNGCGMNAGSNSGLDKIHPGFRGSRSAVLHRFGTDTEYASWRRRFTGSNRNDQANSSSSRAVPTVDGRIQALKEQTTADHKQNERSGRLPAANGFALSLAERNTPALFGVGRIDDISSEVLVAMAASQPESVRGPGQLHPRKAGSGDSAEARSSPGACTSLFGQRVPTNWASRYRGIRRRCRRRAPRPKPTDST